MSKKSIDKQTQVYNFLVKSLSGGLPPTVREIQEKVGIKSTSTVHAILGRLENAGLITRDPYSSRAIRINRLGDSSMVPVVGKVTAGEPILAVESIEDYIPYPVSNEYSGSLFALRVSGLSMRDAGILDGDIIVADKDIPAKNGDIVVALIDDAATVKRLIAEKGSAPYLMPENPDFEPIHADRIDILGKVIGSYRKY